MAYGFRFLKCAGAASAIGAHVLKADRPLSAPYKPGSFAPPKEATEEASPLHESNLSPKQRIRAQERWAIVPGESPAEGLAAAIKPETRELVRMILAHR